MRSSRGLSCFVFYEVVTKWSAGNKTFVISEESWRGCSNIDSSLPTSSETKSTSKQLLQSVHKQIYFSK